MTCVCACHEPHGGHPGFHAHAPCCDPKGYVRLPSGVWMRTTAVSDWILSVLGLGTGLPVRPRTAQALRFVPNEPE